MSFPQNSRNRPEFLSLKHLNQISHTLHQNFKGFKVIGRYQSGGLMTMTHSLQTERTVYSIDLYPDGLAFGQHRIPEHDAASEHLYLRLIGIHDHLKLQSKYGLSGRAVKQELIQHLTRLSAKGLLSTAEIHFGVAHDPFEGQGGHFAHALSLLDVFKTFKPYRLVIQTRSPLAVIALPALKQMGDRVRVVVGIETCLEESVLKYTPGLARCEERLKMVRTMQRFGIAVAVQATPVLPYGEWRKDAQRFARTLAALNVPILMPVESQQYAARGGSKSGLVAKRLAEARAFFYLRSDTALPLTEALQQIAAHLLAPLDVPTRTERQLSLFVA